MSNPDCAEAPTGSRRSAGWPSSTDLALYQGAIRFYNHLQNRGECPNTRKSSKKLQFVGRIVGWKKSTNPVAISNFISWNLRKDRS